MKLSAQTWTCSSAEVVADSTNVYGKDSDPACIYLYNVGTGEYINFGGLWGTQPMTHEVGMPLYLVKGNEPLSGLANSVDSLNGRYYKIGTNTDILDNSNTKVGDGFMGFIRGSKDQSSSSESSWEQLFIDREGTPTNSYDAIVRMIFTQVSSTNTSDTIYNISFRRYYSSTDTNEDVNHNADGSWPTSSISTTGFTTYYLVAQSGDNKVVLANEASTNGSEATDSLAQWKIVTRKALKADFDRTNTAGQTEEANATFMIYDQNFNRNNAHQGKTTLTSSSTDQDDCAWKFTGTGTLNIGCGLDGTSGDQQTYGQYWLACISGIGTLYQEINVFKSGWYQLRLKGVSTVTAAKAFILSMNTSTDYKTAIADSSFTTHNSTTIHQMDTTKYKFGGYSESNVVQIARIDSILDAATSEYRTESYTMVYIPANTKLVIGVTTDSVGSYTLIDDVQLYYTGQSTPLILDENWTNLDYINAQVSSDSTQTLLLKRTLVQDQWNSIVLPVSLTAGQVREAFGDSTIICKLEKTGRSGADIYFRSVAGIDLHVSALHDTTTVMKADTTYIIKPSDLDQELEDYDYTIKSGETTLLDSTLHAPFFAIPMVTFSKKVGKTVTGEMVQDETGSNTIDSGDIYMEGTYLAGEEIPIYSYAISAANGYWYYLKVSGVTSKGYRAWIRTQKTVNGALPAMANLFIDDELIAGSSETTGLEQVVLRKETSGRVYTLSGQMVSASGSLEGLPKGIYIKGGKKYVVK